jgi:hypothetical protein
VIVASGDGRTMTENGADVALQPFDPITLTT